MKGPLPEGAAALSPTLYAHQFEIFTKIIMGEPIDTFDKFVSDWLDMGGAAMTQEVNDVYR